MPSPLEDALPEPISATGAHWKILKKPSANALAKLGDLPEVVAQLLYLRGIKNKEEKDIFLEPDYARDLHDPLLLKGMPEGVELIRQAITDEKKIVVVGDYDVDGICGLTILVGVLKDLGAKVGHYMPSRYRDGYGLTMRVAERLVDDGVDLIITVDNGIRSVDEVEYFKKQGKQVIVTDHHGIGPKLPPADVVINPHQKGDRYPNKHLAGAAVGFKLATALLRAYKSPEDAEKEEKWLLDLVALATVADMMSLTGENRALVHYGLKVLEKTKRLGLKKLIELTRSPRDEDQSPTAETIGWRLGPRLNAAGRLADANTAYQLLMADNDADAQNLLTEIERLNVMRQEWTERIRKAVQQQIGNISDDKKIIIASDTGWPHGVLGIVAGRLTEEYQRPVILLDEEREFATGSARSIESFDITAALDKHADLLERFGGHAAAAGLTLETAKIGEFREEIEKYAGKILKDHDFKRALMIDAEITAKDFTLEVFEAIQKLQPFGEDNLEPVFILKNAEVKDLQTMGDEGQHWRAQVKQKDGPLIKVIGFCLSDACAHVKVGDMIDVAGRLTSNTWNDQTTIEFKIEDVKFSQKYDRKT
ncbi:single-stranded-DNA-specific exonuclease RecJ [Patescibacteria group bacterium]